MTPRKIASGPLVVVKMKMLNGADARVAIAGTEPNTRRSFAPYVSAIQPPSQDENAPVVPPIRPPTRPMKVSGRMPNCPAKAVRSAACVRRKNEAVKAPWP